MLKKFLLSVSTFLLFSCSKEIIQQNLTVDVSPLNGGTVSPPSNAFEKGTLVSLLATPSKEFLFKQWQGSLSGTLNPAPLTMDSDKQVTALFEKRQYPLNLTIEGVGTVKEEIISVATQALYPSGTSVRLTAQAGIQWKFKDWTGDKNSSLNPFELKVDAPLNLKASFVPIFPNYLSTSYDLSNSSTWYASNQFVFSNGNPFLMNPLMDQQSAQLDINLDGFEDVFYYEGYDLAISPTPNPPPAIFLYQAGKLVKTDYKGPTIKHPHGTKLLVGDFNNDTYPDIFSMVAIDPPFNSPPGFLNTFDNCHLLLNSAQGFTRVKEFTDEGFWYTGCSGDIDNDGDLDVLAFNFHNQANGLKSRILWNDGKANFKVDFNGIGDIPVVYESELTDLNRDGFLDLVLIFIPNGPTRTNDFRILWGTGKGFDLANSTQIPLAGKYNVQNLDFADFDKDGFAEILVSGNYDNPAGGAPIYFLSLYQTADKAKSFTEKTESLIEKNTAARFHHLRIADLDNNGLLDVFAADKRDNIRWEWSNGKLVRR